MKLWPHHEDGTRILVLVKAPTAASHLQGGLHDWGYNIGFGGLLFKNSLEDIRHIRPILGYPTEGNDRKGTTKDIKKYTIH